MFWRFLSLRKSKLQEPILVYSGVGRWWRRGKCPPPLFWTQLRLVYLILAEPLLPLPKKLATPLVYDTTILTRTQRISFSRAKHSSKTLSNQRRSNTTLPPTPPLTTATCAQNGIKQQYREINTGIKRYNTNYDFMPRCECTYRGVIINLRGRRQAGALAKIWTGNQLVKPPTPTV